MGRRRGGGRLLGGPPTYKSVLPTLLPGDTLNLEAGTYPLLKISGLRGTPDAWITVQGPPSGPPAVVIGYSGHNTVELVNASYLAVRNLRIDSRWIPGAFGLSAKDGAANLVHDILVEDCVFVGQGGSQQTDAISTKTPTWNWTIRGNVIVGAGVGLYLGASDGSDPFVAGLIEGNLVQNTVLYGGEIKWQGPRPAVPGMPTGPSRTIIRHNVFIKANAAACARPFGCAPNFLVGGFPDAGPGSADLYEIYGNLFYNNPHESLLQASGRVSVHDNLFVNKAPGQAAILLRDHDLPLRLAEVYDNTIYEFVDPRFLNPAVGIRVASVPREGQAITGNLVLARLPIVGYTPDLSGNVTDLPADAGLYVASPSTTLGSMDFHPLATGAARGSRSTCRPSPRRTTTTSTSTGGRGATPAGAAPTPARARRRAGTSAPPASRCRPPGPDQRRTMPPRRASHNSR